MSQPIADPRAGQTHPDPDDRRDAPSPYALLSGELRERLLLSPYDTADWMRNRAG